MTKSPHDFDLFLLVYLDRGLPCPGNPSGASASWTIPTGRGILLSTGLQHEGGIAMRTVSINLDLPQSAELSATLVQMCLSERDPVIKAMLENILEQLRQDYAKKGP